MKGVAGNGTDRFFLRTKDVLIIFGGIAGLAAGAGTLYGRPISNSEKVAAIQTEVTSLREEVRENSGSILRTEAHFSDIMRRLDSIERLLQKGGTI